MVDALCSERSVLTGVRVRISLSAPTLVVSCGLQCRVDGFALVAQRIECFPAKEEVVGSNPT
jgi:hypothetical protein